MTICPVFFLWDCLGFKDFCPDFGLFLSHFCPVFCLFTVFLKKIDRKLTNNDQFFFLVLCLFTIFKPIYENFGRILLRFFFFFFIDVPFFNFKLSHYIIPYCVLMSVLLVQQIIRYIFNNTCTSNVLFLLEFSVGR